MYTRCDKVSIESSQTISFPTAGLFELADRQMVQIYIDKYNPESCEYNFANLFCWQEAYHYSWRLYKGRLMIYDGLSQCAFMPLGEPLEPEELAELAQDLVRMGLEPDVGLVTKAYLDAFPQVEKYFDVEEERDYAEYLYSVDSLFELKGTKLHKKRNLISQFKRNHPDFTVETLGAKNICEAWDFSGELLFKRGTPSQTLESEYMAMEKAFHYFGDLGLEGLALRVDGRMIAFSIFSRLNRATYNVQFEKSDFAYKGAAQVINQETAGYLRGRCEYINREQDLGIKGLRQAKMSYEPARLVTPYTLKFKR